MGGKVGTCPWALAPGLCVTPSSGSSSPSQEVFLTLTPQIHLDPRGDFNEGLFPHRGPWCYPRRGSPRRSLFPR